MGTKSEKIWILLGDEPVGWDVYFPNGSVMSRLRPEINERIGSYVTEPCIWNKHPAIAARRLLPIEPVSR